MGDIYTGSTLNIGATASSDGDGGLYFERDPCLVQPLRLVIHAPWHDEDDSLSNSMSPLAFDCILKKVWLRNVDKAPLSIRAWVMQERTLSPRMIQFAQMQIFWECKQMQACESYLYGLCVPRHDKVKSRVMATLDELDRLKVGRPVSTKVGRLRSEAHRGWIHTIEVYSACSLTKEEDVLIAISGVAKRYVSSLDDVYLAGLMKSSLEFGLLWYTLKSMDASISTRPDTWRAPSWAWPSTKAAVSWDSDHFPVQPHRSPETHSPQFKLIKHYVQSVGKDMTGQLSDAWMKVEASIIELHLVSSRTASNGNENVTPDSFEILGWQKIRVWMDVNGKCYSAEAQFDEIKDLGLPFRDHYDVGQGSRSVRLVTDEAHDAQILAMPILVTLPALDAQDSVSRYYVMQGILLKGQGTSPGGKEGMVRIGRFTIHLNSDDHKEAINHLLNDWKPEKREIILV
jgi:hypothetical protein